LLGNDMIYVCASKWFQLTYSTVQHFIMICIAETRRG